MSFVNRVSVFEEVGSTQDVCRDLASGVPGLLVTSLRQTAGRGRLGRSWTQAQDKGVAATFAIDARRWDLGVLPLAAGLATHLACKSFFPESSADPIGLRWPNDVVEAVYPAGAKSPGRKLAGVLIERTGDIFLLGIGVNVDQEPADFAGPLNGRAASLNMLLGHQTPGGRLAVLEQLISELDSALKLEPQSLSDAWRTADCLVGTTQTFAQGGVRVRGVVRDIDPRHWIVLEKEGGVRVRLPAMTTSIMWDETATAQI
ncbi:MAG: biotin--[acetyl-CoA-carboxylase] ligase [Planctomycetes bacterium]|nr:biotin--[acetyl-CoA-carboxylase] ligase [Planctomycetota bacterium]